MQDLLFVKGKELKSSCEWPIFDTLYAIPTLKSKVHVVCQGGL